MPGAGVLFALDTGTDFPDVVLLNSSYGLGESVVKGPVDPDEFLVFKLTLPEGHRPIITSADASNGCKIGKPPVISTKAVQSGDL